MLIKCSLSPRGLQKKIRGQVLPQRAQRLLKEAQCQDSPDGSVGAHSISSQEGCSGCTIPKTSTRKIPTASYRSLIYLINASNQNAVKTVLIKTLGRHAPAELAPLPALLCKYSRKGNPQFQLSPRLRKDESPDGNSDRRSILSHRRTSDPVRAVTAWPKPATAAHTITNTITRRRKLGFLGFQTVISNCHLLRIT